MQDEHVLVGDFDQLGQILLVLLHVDDARRVVAEDAEVRVQPDVERGRLDRVLADRVDADPAGRERLEVLHADSAAETDGRDDDRRPGEQGAEVGHEAGALGPATHQHAPARDQRRGLRARDAKGGGDDVPMCDGKGGCGGCCAPELCG